jgi:hypothetical protein
MAPLTTAEKRRYAKNCIVQSFLDWEHYKIKPSAGCFDKNKGKCTVDTLKNPTRLVFPFNDEASDTMFYDACQRESFEDVGASDVGDYVDRFVIKEYVDKHAGPGSRSPFW